MRAKQKGFTIVELLIVIVVIAILAAISVVAYNGIQQRAKLSTALSELSNLSKTVSVFQVDQSSQPYPNDPSEWSLVFKKANMFDNTRSSTLKSFILCSTTTGDKFTIIAVRPLSLTDTNGQLFHYRDQSGFKTFIWDNSFTGTFSAERACKQTANGYEFALWAHDLT